MTIWPAVYIKNVVETEPECVFEIGLQYIIWNGKENISSEISPPLKITFFTKK